jgi:hypothetical protein
LEWILQNDRTQLVIQQTDGISIKEECHIVARKPGSELGMEQKMLKKCDRSQ